MSGILAILWVLSGVVAWVLAMIELDRKGPHPGGLFFDLIGGLLPALVLGPIMFIVISMEP